MTTMAELHDYATRYRRKLRHSLRAGPYWRRNAYQLIEAALAEERAYLSSGAPGAAIEYTCIIRTAIEFLEERPNQDRYFDLQIELGNDIYRMEAGFERIGRTYYTPVEAQVIEGVFECLTAYRRLIAVHCSRPT